MAMRLVQEGVHAGTPALVKAEILLTRRCPLRCSGCAIYRVDSRGSSDSLQSQREELSSREWGAVLDNLKQLGCGFLAIYGAEPLQVYDLTREVVGYAENVSHIPCTVITSGLGLTEERLEGWWAAGLRSLTMSVDGLAEHKLVDASVRKKSSTAEHWLAWWVRRFSKHSCYRDAETVVTLTRENFIFLPDLVRYFDSIGVWVHFDLIHPSRGQPYSKASHRAEIEHLLFTPAELPALRAVLEQVVVLKNAGARVHPSYEALELMGSSQGVEHGWQCCSGDTGFVGMVSVDVNGVVRPCDDFLPPEMDVPHEHATAAPERRGRAVRKGRLVLVEDVSRVDSDPIFGWELSSRWDEYQRRTRQMVRQYGCRCAWSTHLDAQNIWEGKGARFEHFVHKQVGDS